MEKYVFLSALSTSIICSLGQGFMIYVLTRIIFMCSPGLPAGQRFRILYGALVLIFTGFILSFLKSYSPETAQSAYMFPDLAIPAQVNNPDLNNIGFSLWIGIFYFAGLLTQSVIMLGGMLRIRQIRDAKKYWADLRWEDRLQALSRKMGIRSRVRLHLAERIFSPFTAGYLKPVIIFPIAMLNRLSTEQVEAILLHELAHIKRQDYLLGIAEKAMRAILFFNPFTWLISGSLAKEREYACDDLVIAHSPDAGQYAKALLLIAESGLKNCSPGIAASGDKKYNLLNRIKRLTDMKTPNYKPKHRLIALAGITAVCLSLAWIIPADKKHAEPVQKIEKPGAPTPPAEPVAPAEPLAPAAPVTPMAPPVPEAPAPLPAGIHLPPIPADTNIIEDYFKSEEWKKHLEKIRSNAEEIGKQFDSQEWKQKMADLQVNAAEIRKQFESPEWKKQIEDIKQNAEKIREKFNSPEWKQQVGKIRLEAEQIRKKLDSPEWKKQLEEIKLNSLEIRKKVNSEEWKQKIESLKKEAEKNRIQLQEDIKLKTDSI